MNAVAAAQAIDGWVAFPDVYEVSQQLVLGAGVRMMGYGGGIKAASSIDQDDILIYVDTAGSSGFYFTGMEIDGNADARGDTVTNNGHGFRFDGTTANPITNVEFRDCYIHHVSGFAMNMTAIQSGVYQDMLIEHTGHDGITHYRDAQRIQIRGVRFSDIGDDCIAINGSDTGMGSSNVARDIIIDDITIRDNVRAGSGIKIRGCDGVVVSNFDIRDTYGPGVILGNANGQSCRDIVISNGVIEDAGETNTGGSGPGISIQPGLASFSDGGVVADCENIHISNVIIRNPRSHGIEMLTTSTAKLRMVTIDKVTVTCGTLYTSGKGITATGADLHDITVTDCLIVNSQKDGIVLGDNTNAVTRPTVRNCTVIDSGLNGGAPGIRLYKPVSPMLHGNRCFNRDATTPNWMTYGAEINTATGVVTMYGNDFAGAATAPYSTPTPSGATWQFTTGYHGTDSSTVSNIRFGGTNRGLFFGEGSPEGVITAWTGSLYLDKAGGAGTCLYVKESDPTYSTGWVAK